MKTDRMTEAVRGFGKGAKSVKDLKYIQDGPPAGGFPAIRYARRIGAPGPTGVAIFGVGAAICAYGFYRVGQANHKRNEYLKEKVAARKALLPVLQAEEVRQKQKNKSLHVQRLVSEPGTLLFLFLWEHACSNLFLFDMMIIGWKRSHI